MQEVTDDYELVRPLGTGGFAKVYVGRNLSTGEDVAINRIDMLKCDPRSCTAVGGHLWLSGPGLQWSWNSVERELVLQ